MSKGVPCLVLSWLCFVLSCSFLFVCFFVCIVSFNIELSLTPLTLHCHFTINTKNCITLFPLSPSKWQFVRGYRENWKRNLLENNRQGRLEGVCVLIFVPKSGEVDRGTLLNTVHPRISAFPDISAPFEKAPLLSVKIKNKRTPPPPPHVSKNVKFWSCAITCKWCSTYSSTAIRPSQMVLKSADPTNLVQVILCSS